MAFSYLFRHQRACLQLFRRRKSPVIRKSKLYFPNSFPLLFAPCNSERLPSNPNQISVQEHSCVQSTPAECLLLRFVLSACHRKTRKNVYDSLITARGRGNLLMKWTPARIKTGFDGAPQETHSSFISSLLPSLIFPRSCDHRNGEINTDEGPPDRVQVEQESSNASISAD